MRYGLLSDVHGNLPALESALAVLAGEGVDAFICAGDLVGYGPHPNECVERVLSLPGICVAGNHDLIAVGILSDQNSSHAARVSLAWTSAQLTPITRAALARLRIRESTDDGVTVSHGSFDDPEEYVTKPSHAIAELAKARRHDSRTRVLVLGHTHRAVAVQATGRSLQISRMPGEPLPVSEWPVVVNPGSVGQSREARVHARFALLDLEAGRLRFWAVEYAYADVQAALRRNGLPASTLHAPPRSVWRRAVGRARRSIVSVPSGLERVARRCP